MSKGKLAKISSLRPEVVLRPHQELAVDKVLSSGRGLIAHPVGSGKTLTAIAAIEKLRERGKADKTLVVLPASLKSNFIRDGVQRFTDSHAVDGVDGASPYQVVSIDRLRNNPQGVFRDSKADTIVFDEIHRAKDSGSKTHRAVQSLSDESKNFIGLTGSLVSNHPREVVPLLNLVHPGHTLPKTTSSFSKKYTEQKSQKTPGVWGVFEKGTMKTHIRESTRPELGDRMRTFVDYVPLEAMSGDIPRMEIKDVHVPMTTEQTKQYDFALGRLTPWQRERIRKGLPVNQTEAKKMLAMLTKARQASNALHIHKEMPLEVSAEKTPKVRRILDDVEKHLRENKDGQAVIYSNFVQGGADAAVAGLKNRGYDVGVFAGVGALGNTVSVESRQKAVDDFKAGKKRVIVMTPAGTEGVSLNNATAFFEMDRHYNPERNNQAIARGRRMGGLSHRPAEERKLEVYRYYSDPQSSLRLFGGQAKGVDEWIGNVAKEKDRLNQELRDSIVKKASVVEADMQKLRLRHLSSDLHPVLTPLSYDRLQEVRGPMKERMSKGELVWLTGRGGAGKSTMAKQMSPEFDMVVGSDTGYVDPVQKKWIEPTPEEKLRIRSERARDILKAKSEGKRVLFEGAPGPASKYPSELLAGIDRIVALKVPKSVLKQNVIARSKERGSWNDPKARADDLANFEALYNNYTDKLKEIRGLTKAPIEHRVPEYVRHTQPTVVEKMAQAALGGAAGGLLGAGHAALLTRIHNRALAERLQQAVRTGNTDSLGAQELRLLKNLQAAKAKL